MRERQPPSRLYTWSALRRTFFVESPLEIPRYLNVSTASDGNVSLILADGGLVGVMGGVRDLTTRFREAGTIVSVSEMVISELVGEIGGVDTEVLERESAVGGQERRL